MAKTHDTTFVLYLEREASIWEADYKDQTPRIGLNDARLMVKERLDLQGGQPIRLLIHGVSIWRISLDSQRYLASHEGVEGIVAIAILYRNRVLCSVMTFLNKWFHNLVPVEIFPESDHEDAVEWLKEQPLHNMAGVPA